MWEDGVTGHKSVSCFPGEGFVWQVHTQILTIFTVSVLMCKHIDVSVV